METYLIAYLIVLSINKTFKSNKLNNINYYFRLISCPNKVNFFKKVMNWIDLFAIVPYFVTVVNTELFSFLQLGKFKLNMT